MAGSRFNQWVSAHAEDPTKLATGAMMSKLLADTNKTHRSKFISVPIKRNAITRSTVDMQLRIVSLKTTFAVTV